MKGPSGQTRAAQSLEIMVAVGIQVPRNLIGDPFGGAEILAREGKHEFHSHTNRSAAAAIGGVEPEPEGDDRRSCWGDARVEESNQSLMACL